MMAKKERELEFFPTAAGTLGRNYRVYVFKPWERILYFLLGSAAGAFVGYLFYGGIGKDDFGNPTFLTRVLDLAIPAATGLYFGCMALPLARQALLERRTRELARQFRDMLDAFTTSLGAGKNVMDACVAVYQDLKVQYAADAYILQEMEILLAGIQNNVEIESLLEDFGQRSGIGDIQSFASVFRIAYRKGGNLKEIMRNTHGILTDKMEIREEIETVVTSNKTEQNIMIVMPVLLIAVIKGMSPEFGANYAKPSGLIATTVALVIFAVAHKVGKILLDIKV